MAVQSARQHVAQAAEVVTTALQRASAMLAIPQKDLASIIGVSEAKISRAFRPGDVLELSLKQQELALLFLRVFRSLNSMVGGSAEQAKKWFAAQNLHLRGVPAELVKSAQGLIHVAEYLDAFRGKV